MTETLCAYTVYELCIYIYLIKRRDTLYQINKKYFAKPFWLSFLCIQGARANGNIIYRRCCAIFWPHQTGTRADKKEMHTVVNCRMLCTVDP
jgi:hypothetical protein